MTRHQAAKRSPSRDSGVKSGRSIHGNAVRLHAIPTGRVLENQTGKRRRKRSRSDKSERRRSTSVRARVERVGSPEHRPRIAFFHDARRDGLEQRLVAANGQHEVERSPVAESAERVCRRAPLYRRATRKNQRRAEDNRARGAASRDAGSAVTPSQDPPSISRRRLRWRRAKFRFSTRDPRPRPRKQRAFRS